MSSNQPGSASIEKNKRRINTFKKNNFHNTSRKNSVERRLKDKFKLTSNDNLIENSKIENGKLKAENFSKLNAKYTSKVIFEYKFER